jgi:hypothetical protein
VDGTITAVDQAFGHIEQVQELGCAQATKLDVVDLPLDWGELREEGIALVRDFQPNTSPVAGIRELANEAALEQVVRDGRHEGPAQEQMLGHAVDADVGFFDGQMPDRNQNRVFDSDEADPGRVTGANRFVTRKKTEQAVDQATEVAIRPVDEELGARNGQRRRHVRIAAPGLCFRCLSFDRTRHAYWYLNLPDRLIAKLESCQRYGAEIATLLLRPQPRRRQTGGGGTPRRIVFG